ncbi:MAG: cytochrome c [Acidobacteria bacterium]|nr:MAG: cytochrome c [Acidobacteriota bacterium]
MLSWLPLALVAKARFSTSTKPPIHLFTDMDQQRKFKTQSVNPLFRDARAMRPPVPGTVARGELQLDEHFYEGKVDGEWATTFPDQVKIDAEALRRGQERYNIYCAPCHGLAGYGDGMVSRRAEQLEEPAWVPPSSYHTDLVRSRPVGHIFNTITYGIRNMPGYGAQIPVADRWKIVAYVRALQRSQNASIEDVPEALRDSLRQEAAP